MPKAWQFVISEPELPTRSESMMHWITNFLILYCTSRFR